LLERVCFTIKRIFEVDYTSSGSNSGTQSETLSFVEHYMKNNGELTSRRKNVNSNSDKKSSQKSRQSTSESCEMIQFKFELPKTEKRFTMFSRKVFAKRCSMARGDKEAEMEFTFESKSCKQLPHISSPIAKKPCTQSPIKIIIKEEEAKEDEPEEVEEEIKYKYCFNTFQKPFMNVDNTMGTDDEDLYLFSEHINDPMTSSAWEKVDETKIISTYKKTIPGSEILMTKTVSMLDFDKETVFKAITDIDTRKSWDKVLKEYYMIEGDCNKAVIYTLVKGVALVVSERETIQQRKTWKNFPDKDSICIHYRSVEHEKAPRKKSIVRAEVIIAGYYFKTISVNPPKTMFVTFDQFDFKGNVPKFVINKFATKVPKEWVGNLITACKKVSTM